MTSTFSTLHGIVPRATGAILDGILSHKKQNKKEAWMSTPNTEPRPFNPPIRRNPPIEGEHEAIEKAQQGDPEAFEMLYALHKRRVYSLCLRMLGNIAEAEDLTQEAFLQLYRKI